MGEKLPAVPLRAEVAPRRTATVVRGGGLRRWVRSPLADALVDVAPDLLRLTGRAVRPHPLAGAAPGLPPSGANGLTVSEIEIDVASPLLRRVVVRSTNAWSLAPEVALGKRRRGGLLRLGAVSVAGLTLLGIVMGRRAPRSLPSRVPRQDPF